MTGSAGSGVGVLVIVENLPVPFDRRVWQEATALRDAGFTVSVICPKGRGYEKSRDLLDGIQIYRHGMPKEADGAWGYILEYSAALLHESRLAWWVLLRRGFTVIHACNPPDLLFLVAIPFKLLGKKFLFDHHDIAPELYEAKFGHRGFWYRWLLRVERWTFALADVSIATNESYREIAINRGRMAADRVFVVSQWARSDEAACGTTSRRATSREALPCRLCWCNWNSGGNRPLAQGRPLFGA